MQGFLVTEGAIWVIRFDIYLHKFSTDKLLSILRA